MNNNFQYDSARQLKVAEQVVRCEVETQMKQVLSALSSGEAPPKILNFEVECAREDNFVTVDLWNANDYLDTPALSGWAAGLVCVENNARLQPNLSAGVLFLCLRRYVYWPAFYCNLVYPYIVDGTPAEDSPAWMEGQIDFRVAGGIATGSDELTIITKIASISCTMWQKEDSHWTYVELSLSDGVRFSSLSAPDITYLNRVIKAMANEKSELRRCKIIVPPEFKENIASNFSYSSPSVKIVPASKADPWVIGVSAWWGRSRRSPRNARFDWGTLFPGLMRTLLSMRFVVVWPSYYDEI